MVFESINKNGHRNRKIINNVKEVLLDSASFHVAIKGQTKTLNDSTFSTLLSLVKSVENDRSIKPEEKLNRSLSLMISFGNGQFQGSQQGHFAHVINELFKIKHKNGEYVITNPLLKCMDYQELLETLGWLNRLFVGQKMLDHISSAPKGQIVTEENKEEEPRIDLEAKEVNLDMLQLLKNKFGK